MILELQEPFKSKWSKGYLRTGDDGRSIVDLYNSDSDRTTISYARYLYGVKLGYEVPSQYEVDHIDNNKTNDLIGNLQLLTPEQNKLKQEWYYAMYVQECYGFECVWCQMRFILTKAEVNKRIHSGGEHAFCSRSCSASYHTHISRRSLNTNCISNEAIANIKTLRSQGLSVYKIADVTNISRNTIMKYW